MLGQLFNSINPRRTYSRPANQIESSTEDSHTKSLLFPEASLFPNAVSSIYESPTSPGPNPGYDGIQGEIDLEHSRDIRIIIAQDESGSTPRAVLFDSKQSHPRVESPKTFSGRGGRQYPNPNPPTTPATPAPAHGHTRRSSLVTDSVNPRSPGLGAFQRHRSRASSISSMPNIDQLTSGRRQQDADTGLQNTCLECMFGNISMGYKGIGNKLHIIPLEPRAIDQSIASFASEGQGSLPKGDLRKRSNLAKSYTPSNPPPELSNPTVPSVDPAKDRRRTVLISRIFSVSLPDETENSESTTVSTPTPQNSVTSGNSFPFPQLGKSGSNTPSSFSRRSRPPKLPMYGISIVMQLPVAPKLPRVSSHVGSFPGNESLGSSADSDRRGGWSWIDSSFGVDSLLSASYSSDVDERVDTVGQHWDVIIRTLTSVQFVVQERVLAHLKAADSLPPQIPIQAPRPHRPAIRDPQIQMPPRRNPRLPPYAFSFDPEIQKAVNIAGERVVRGMKIPRVMTGQGRWGVWREEARWLGKWAGSKEENFFFFTLLTAFLGHHTEWLNVLGPKKHRRLHRKQQRSTAGEDLTISNRTVIVGSDKMAARRLIFLLSAFLPASMHTQAYDGASPIRPGTSASGRGYSQSPPHQFGVSRQQSLRRTINRRHRPNQPPVRLPINAKHSDSMDDRSEAISFDTPEDLRGHSRRPSEARSTRTALAFPPLSESPSNSKSSTTITPTSTADAPLPVAHFAMRRTYSSGPNDARPDSSDSLASSNLMHTLKRNSTHVATPIPDSQSSGRWSTIMSFWSGSRASSATDPGEFFQSTDEGLGINGQTFRPPGDLHSPPTLKQMVVEADQLKHGYDSETTEMALEDATNEDTIIPNDIPSSGARDIPRRPKSIHEPLKLSVNENDGVIDVNIPLPGFGGSPVQSPLIPGFHPSSSFEGSSVGFSSSGSFSGDYDQPINVAGWLGKFHADFELQGVNPYPELEKDIRRAMSAEPTPLTAASTPNLESGPTEKWVDICSALVADTATFTVKRLRLRRLVRLVPIPSQSLVTPGPFSATRVPLDTYNSGAAAPVMPMSEVHLEEKFTEEPVMDIDSTLADAIERILAQSRQASQVQSEASSRSSSRRGRADGRTNSDVPTPPVLEIPRQECKQLVFGALEQVVKSVQEERDVKSGSSAARTNRSNDSSLREGVKRWLEEVE